MNILFFSKHENVVCLKKSITSLIEGWEQRRGLSCLSISDPGQKYEFLFVYAVSDLQKEAA